MYFRAVVFVCFVEIGFPGSNPVVVVVVVVVVRLI